MPRGERSYAATPSSCSAFPSTPEHGDRAVTAASEPAPSPSAVVRAVPEGQVVYGMQLPIQSQSTLYVAPWEKQAGPAVLGRIAREADDAGFFYFGVGGPPATPTPLCLALGANRNKTT